MNRLHGFFFTLLLSSFSLEQNKADCLNQGFFRVLAHWGYEQFLELIDSAAYRLEYGFVAELNRNSKLRVKVGDAHRSNTFFLEQVEGRFNVQLQRAVLVLVVPFPHFDTKNGYFGGGQLLNIDIHYEGVPSTKFQLIHLNIEILLQSDAYLFVYLGQVFVLYQAALLIHKKYESIRKHFV